MKTPKLDKQRENAIPSIPSDGTNPEGFSEKSKSLIPSGGIAGMGIPEVFAPAEAPKNAPSPAGWHTPTRRAPICA